MPPAPNTRSEMKAVGAYRAVALAMLSAIARAARPTTEPPRVNENRAIELLGVLGNFRSGAGTLGLEEARGVAALGFAAKRSAAARTRQG